MNQPWPRPDSIDREQWRISAIGVIWMLLTTAWVIWANLVTT